MPPQPTLLETIPLFAPMDDEERKAVRRKIAQIMGLYVDILVAVFHQYPDLDTDPPPSDNFRNS